ncbi:FtsX-like permease family protein [Janibacter alkaliphilus]|nr:FtsX-like permease family protein [Janibacter alkaliphilus]
MWQVTIASLRSQSRRLVAPGIAIILGVAFAAASLSLGQTLGGSVRSMVAGYYTDYDAVVATGDTEPMPAATLTTVQETEGVQRAVGELRAGSTMATPTGPAYVVAATSPTEQSSARVEDGRLPRAADEIALSRVVASADQLAVGDEVSLSADEGPGSEVTVVGIVDAGADPRYAGGTPAVFGSHDAVSAWTGEDGYSEIVVRGTEEVTADELTDRLRERTGGVAGASLGDDGATGSTTEGATDDVNGDDESSPVTVDTGTDHADAVTARLAGGTDVITGMLLAFAAVALFVSAIVIANTFGILLARRTRETALLRAVGSTRAQVVQGAVVEALATGVVFSAIGTAIGIALCGGLVALANASGSSTFPELVFTTSITAVLVPFVVGVVVVLAAALRPVLRASRVAPLEALRPAGTVAARSTAGLVRIGLGLALLAGGAGLLVLGWQTAFLAAGLAGGMTSFLGVLLIGSLLVPTLARIIGAVPAAVLGAPGRLAVGNAVANPRRAAATASALLVGVTLVTMTAVGARSAEASITAELDDRYSVDAAVTATDGELEPGLVDDLREIDGVTGVATVPGSEVSLGVDGTTHEAQAVVGVSDETRSVLRNGDRLDRLTDGTIYVTSDVAEGFGVADGDRVTVRGGSGPVTLTAVVDDALGYDWVVTGADLDRIGGDVATRAAFLRLAEGDPGSTVEAIDEVVADAGVEVGGSAAQRAEMSQVLDAVLYVVLSLLAVSVVIALVGIANTLSLSVLERTQESALLRALGTTRAQLRRMVAIESVLLALVGVTLGSALGIVYGVAGVGALVGELTPVVVEIPWGLLGGVAAAAVVAALVAAVLPAVRAARVSPAAALATD